MTTPDSEPWRTADSLSCPTCDITRPVDQRDAQDPRIGGYYCQGGIAGGAPHRPVILAPNQRSQRTG